MAGDRARKAAIYARRLLNIRPRSEKELKSRLFGKGFGRETVEEIVADFKKKSLIDDYKFAKFWVESRIHVAPRSDMLIRKELMQKGVPGSVINRVMSEKSESEETVAKEIAKKRFDKLKGVPKEKSRKKLFDFLARKGFDFDIIRDIIEEFYAE